MKEKPDEIACRGGRFVLDTSFPREVLCDTCGRRQGPDDGSEPQVGDRCPSDGVRRALYLRRMDHYKHFGVYDRLKQLREDCTPTRVLRSSGEWTACKIKATVYFNVYLHWESPSGKWLQKPVDIDVFIENHPQHFADLPNAKGPTESD